MHCLYIDSVFGVVSDVGGTLTGTLTQLHGYITDNESENQFIIGNRVHKRSMLYKEVAIDNETVEIVLSKYLPAYSEYRPCVCLDAVVEDGEIKTLSVWSVDSEKQLHKTNLITDDEIPIVLNITQIWKALQIISDSIDGNIVKFLGDDKQRQIKRCRDLIQIEGMRSWTESTAKEKIQQYLEVIITSFGRTFTLASIMFHDKDIKPIKSIPFGLDLRVDNECVVGIQPTKVRQLVEEMLEAVLLENQNLSADEIIDKAWSGTSTILAWAEHKNITISIEAVRKQVI